MSDEYRILLSKRVASHLEQIFDHVALDSPRNGSKLIEEILVAIDSLKLFPKRQLVRNESNARNSIRSLPVGNYMIFFEVQDEYRIVKIIRVAHSARKRPKRFE